MLKTKSIPTPKKQPETSKKCKSLTTAQKKEVCLKKLASPFLKNRDLAKEFDVNEGMICDTLKTKECWLAVNLNSHQAGLKHEKKVPFPLIEEALTIWVENALQNGPVSGIKQSKDHVTILLTCNAIENEKLPPLFIHKYENPQALKNINKKTLPVDYYWNKKSWMQVLIWNEYIKKLNNRMRRQNQNILLLVDNALTYTLYETTYLTNITIKYLSPNTMSHLQPCDQGIINNFKS